jgi:hypothetical protein
MILFYDTILSSTSGLRLNDRIFWAEVSPHRNQSYEANQLQAGNLCLNLAVKKQADELKKSLQSLIHPLNASKLNKESQRDAMRALTNVLSMPSQ